MKEVRVGYIGLGPRSQGLIKQSLKMNVRGWKISALCDTNGILLERGRDLVKDVCPDVQCFTDHRKLLKDGNIDAVFLLVAPENNASLVCESLAAGKHVMCEVPLTFSIDECWETVLAVEKSGLKFQMAEQVRYSPFIQAWKRMVAAGELGKIVYAEGQYLHGGTDKYLPYWYDGETGRPLTIEEGLNNPSAVKSRKWTMPHPILYLPHELSPILNVLDDRVDSVTCMGTRRQSYLHEWFPVSDVEVASMHTAKDTVIRLTAGFTISTISKTSTGTHWYHLMGTKGSVETNRSNADKMKLWRDDPFMKEPEELMWEFNPQFTSTEAMGSGHGGIDYYPMATFIDSILNDTDPPMDIYRAVESAAPAIVAAQSVEQGSACLPVPDFRPGKSRKASCSCDASISDAVKS